MKGQTAHFFSSAPPETPGHYQKSRVRILVCDDHALFREGIKAILKTDPELEVIGEAGDGHEAVEAARRLRPAVVLMDISMPGLIGYEAIRRIAQADKSIKILALTMYDEEEIIEMCLNAGACGYVLKDASTNQLIEAVHAICKGGKYLSPRVLNKVMDRYGRIPGHVETRFKSLSDREREVLKLLGDGLSVKEIASLLNLSVKTVEAHKYNLMRKLDIHDRTELIKYALNKKLTEPLGFPGPVSPGAPRK